MSNEEKIERIMLLQKSTGGTEKHNRVGLRGRIYILDRVLERLEKEYARQQEHAKQCLDKQKEEEVVSPPPQEILTTNYGAGGGRRNIKKGEPFAG